MAAITYSLGLNAGPLTRAMIGVRAMFSDLTGFVGGLTGRLNGLLAPIGGIGGILREAFVGAAEMESTSVAFTTLTRHAGVAKRVMEELKALADSTPFEFPELASAAKSLLAFKSSASEVTNELRMIGDISSLIGAPIGEIAELYGKARVQGRLFAQDINQLTGRGIDVLSEFAKQFGVGTDAVKGLVESGEIGFEQLRK